MSLATRRQIGGASNLWAGRCVPFDPVDFRDRNLVGSARWPLEYGELERHFSRACEWCMCGEPSFDASRIPTLAGAALIPGWPEGDVRSTSLERWSLPTNFGRAYRARLRSSRLVTVVSGLTCTEIICSREGRRVAFLDTRTRTHGRVQVRAKRYVLACGGIESTRLLFASNGRQQRGIGNHSGHLGRWYMTHLGASIAQVHFSTPPARTIYGFERDPDGVYVRRRFTFSPDYLVRHDLPNAAMWLENPEIGDPSHGSAILSFIYLVLTSPLARYIVAEGIRRRKVDVENPASSWLHVRNIARHLPRAAWFALTFGYEHFVRRGHKVPGVFVASASNVYRLYYHGEHLPHYRSRVAPTVNAMHSEYHACAHDSVSRTMTSRVRSEHTSILITTCADTGSDIWSTCTRIPGRRFESLLDGYHQAGTTRMSDRPEDGVLDEHRARLCRSPFVASSSASSPRGRRTPPSRLWSSPASGGPSPSHAAPYGRAERPLPALQVGDIEHERWRRSWRHNARRDGRAVADIRMKIRSQVRSWPKLDGMRADPLPAVREILESRVGEEMVLRIVT